MVHVITSLRDKDIIRNNLKGNRYIFNQIRHMQAIGNNIIIPLLKNLTPDHIGDVVNIPLRSEWYDSIFSNHEKISASTTFIAPFLRSSIPPDTKILKRIMHFRFKTTDIDNQSDIS